MFGEKAFKSLALLTLFVLLVSSLIGCGATPEPTAAPEATDVVAEPTEAAEEPTQAPEPTEAAEEPTQAPEPT
ncbi:MAG: hypothetical protein PVH59_09040, partial [Anaerolineae bacterium]